jgi:hydrogenase expression/formation protein HypC
MCLAIPSKIIKIEGDWAIVRGKEHTHRANLSLLKNAKVGDYVLVHADLVLNRVEKQEAEKILKILGDE